MLTVNLVTTAFVVVLASQYATLDYLNRIRDDNYSTNYARYTPTALERDAKNRLYVPVRIGNDIYALNIDTGCDTTLLDKSFVKSLGCVITADPSNKAVGPSGQPIALSKTTLKSIQIGPILLVGFETYAMNFDESITSRRSPTGLRVIGYLGIDFVAKYRVVIDHGQNTMLTVDDAKIDARLLQGRWNPIFYELDGIKTYNRPYLADVHIEFDRYHVYFRMPTPGYSYQAKWTHDPNRYPKSLQENSVRGIDGKFHLEDNKKFKGELSAYYNVTPETLTYASYIKGPTYNTNRLSTEDGRLLIYFCERIGPIPDEQGRTFAERIPFLCAVKQYFPRLEGPHRVRNYDWSLNCNLTVRGVEVGGAKTVTYHLDGSVTTKTAPTQETR